MDSSSSELFSVFYQTDKDIGLDYSRRSHTELKEDQTRGLFYRTFPSSDRVGSTPFNLAFWGSHPIMSNTTSVGITAL
ncbi:MAG: hypothetical protein KME06_12560 [Kastovskya adunca ATA6-11-RM4]|nr:hypothetical protein [Kastovskya adunca ATA6-11-RM4]